MNGIKTRPILVEDLEVLQRVMITGGDFDGMLGTISGVAEGCACRDGWTYVLLDNGIRDEFRHGYRGDRSDLLLVISEPNPPTFNFLRRQDAKIGQAVKIWPGSQDYGRHAERGVGEILKIDWDWVLISFSDGFVDWFSLKETAPSVMPTDEPIPPKRDFVTTDSVRRGLRVTIVSTHHRYGHLSRHGEAKVIHVFSDGWVKVEFDDGAREEIPIIDSGATMQPVN